MPKETTRENKKRNKKHREKSRKKEAGEKAAPLAWDGGFRRDPDQERIDNEAPLSNEGRQFV